MLINYIYNIYIKINGGNKSPIWGHFVQILANNTTSQTITTNTQLSEQSRKHNVQSKFNLINAQAFL